MLAGLDVLVIDLQDVGTRVYTFVYTMANCLKAAKRVGLPVLVCDRPNPIGGDAVEGPMLRAGFESFVGLYPIPLRHGMTIGELARLFNDRFGIGAELEVIPMEGWTREMYWDEHAAAVDHPVAEHADAGYGDRVSGSGAGRGHAVVGGAGDDEAVRVHGDAGHRRG